jgi:hypothetical protein
MRKTSLLPLFAFFAAIALSCQFATPAPSPTSPPVSRRKSIPAAAVKGSPASDAWQPVTAAGWSAPKPMDGPVNTAGAEDSPFLSEDGQGFYFFFTPDPNLPPGQTASDGVTGIWVARRGPDGWLEPERVPLAEPGVTHVDGCEFLLGDRMYFCSIRAGNHNSIDWWTATLRDGVWGEIANAGEWLNGDQQVGELHITAGYRELYFGSERPGGLGGLDLWAAEASAGGWGPPRNLGPQVNTAGDESRPFVTADGNELWFTAQPSHLGHPGPATIRCLRQSDGTWNDCREIVGCFAGEPNLSNDGRTLFFVHHFYSADGARMIEADIYTSQRQ